MKKSSFTAMILGSVSGVLFALGMCMALISEWGTMTPGIVLGCVGILLGIITVIVWRRMEHKTPIKISGRNAFAVFVGIIGALTLGAGMCFVMVWEKIVLGTLIGLIGILILLCLIPLIKGIK